MGDPKPTPKVGQIWELGKHYYVVTCLRTCNPRELVMTRLVGSVELERCEYIFAGVPKTRYQPLEVRSSMTARWPFSWVMARGPTKWIEVGELRREGQFLQHHGGRIVSSSYICDECGACEPWSYYPGFGEIPPGWSAIHGPILCDACTRKRQEDGATPPLSPKPGTPASGSPSRGRCASRRARK